MNKGNKLIWLFLSIIFAVGAIVFGSMYDNKKKDDLVKEVGVSDTKVGKMTLSSLYFDKEKVFLAKGTTKQQISSMEKTAKTKEDKKMVEDLKNKVDVQTRLNQLFKEPVLVGDKFKENIPLKKDYNKADFDSLVSDVTEFNKKENPFYKSVLNYLSKVDTSIVSETESNDSEKTGSAQKAQEYIDEIIVDGAVRSDFTLEQYHTAKDAVDSLPSGDEKDSLMGQIEKIQTALTNMGITY